MPQGRPINARARYIQEQITIPQLIGAVLKKTKYLPLLILILPFILLGGACSSTADVDKIGLYYTGGWIQGQHFKKVVKSGSGATFLGWGDDIKFLPAGQRNYIISKKDTEGDRKGADFIEVPAKGGVRVQFEVSVFFKLNTHTDDIPGFKGGTVRKFYEQICKKYNCTEDDGWDKMLNDNFRKIIETSMRQKVFSYTIDELYANAEGEASGKTDAINKIQTEIATSIKDNINTTLGGQYFCGPQFDRNKPECPDFQFIINSAEPPEDVRKSFEAQRIAGNEVVTAQNRAKSKAAEAEGTRLQQEALRQSLTPEYLELQRIEALKLCAQNPGCTIINGGGGNVIVDAKK